MTFSESVAFSSCALGQNVHMADGSHGSFDECNQPYESEGLRVNIRRQTKELVSRALSNSMQKHLWISPTLVGRVGQSNRGFCRFQIEVYLSKVLSWERERAANPFWATLAHDADQLAPRPDE